MKSKRYYCIYILFFLLCNISKLTAASSQATNHETLQTHPFVGEWIFSSKSCNTESWFSIEISTEKSDGHFKGVLKEIGTHCLKEGAVILSFHQVGDEYWGNLTIYSSPDSCKVIEGNDSHKIEIITSYGRVYRGKKISPISNSKNIETISSIKLNKSILPSKKNIQQKPSSEKTFPSCNSGFSDLSVSGYGEISEKTGRPKTVHVKGYTRKDGTYVQPHYRSLPKRK